MVILATDMEKVEQKSGIDEVVLQIAEECRSRGVPLVFTMGRQRLGALTKFKGQKVGACGVMNFQSANLEFAKLVEAASEGRTAFYEALSQEDRATLVVKMRQNQFIDWNHQLIKLSL